MSKNCPSNIWPVAPYRLKFSRRRQERARRLRHAWAGRVPRGRNPAPPTPPRARVLQRIVRLVGLRAVAGAIGSGLDLRRELLELLGERGSEALELGDLLAVAREAELGGELLLVEQRLLGPLGRLDGLDLDRAVTAQARRGRDQLADDHVLLEA